jgi:hypothetical protein
MVAALGNNYATKLKNPEARQRAYQAYCDWLAKGKTKKSFTFVEDDLMCCWATIESYIKEAPQDFDPLKKEIAYARGCAFWEDAVDETALGIRKETSVPTLNMVMRNKYKWDTVEHSNDVQEKTADLRALSQDMKAGRAERTGAQPASHSAKPADSDVQPPCPHRFE